MLKKRAFWFSFFASLAVLCPLYLAVLAYSTLTQGTKPVDTAQSGIRIVQPTAKDQKTVLVMTGDNTAQQPTSFVLVHFNALENAITALSMPPQTVVLVEGKPVTLAQAVESAGPSQGVAALAQTLEVTIDNYLFASPATLWQTVESFGTMQVRLGEYLKTKELQDLQLALPGTEMQSLTPRMLAQILGSSVLSEKVRLQLRAVGYAECLEVGVSLLESTLPESVRRNSAKLATNITATQLYDYERVLRFLDKQQPLCRGAVLPGTFTAQDQYELTQTATQMAQNYLKGKPNDAIA